MAQDDAEVRRWSSEAAIQEQILRGELAQVLRGRLYEMQAEHLISEGQEDEADRMINFEYREEYLTVWSFTTNVCFGFAAILDTSYR
jgi:hypothetical protein